MWIAASNDNETIIDGKMLHWVIFENVSLPVSCHRKFIVSKAHKHTQTRWWNVGVRRSAKAHDGTLIDAISGSEETVQYSGENDNNSLVSHGCNSGTTAQPRRIQNATHIAMPYNPVRLQTASQRASERVWTGQNPRLGCWWLYILCKWWKWKICEMLP